MTQNKMKSTSATTYSLSGQDFGDPKPKKTDKPARKNIIISENPFMIRCPKCNKRNFISPSPITETRDLICSCGTKVAKYAAKDYGEKQRKINARLKAQQQMEEESQSQII